MWNPNVWMVYSRPGFRSQEEVLVCAPEDFNQFILLNIYCNWQIHYSFVTARFLFLSLWLSLSVSLYLSLWLFVLLSLFISVSLSLCLSVPFVSLPFCFFCCFVSLSLCLFVSLSTSLYLSVCIYVFFSLSLSICHTTAVHAWIKIHRWPTV